MSADKSVSECPKAAGTVVIDSYPSNKPPQNSLTEDERANLRDPMRLPPLFNRLRRPYLDDYYTLSKYADTYELEKYKTNIMYIFNHVKVDTFPEDRHGTEEDVKALMQTFSEFGFVVPGNEAFQNYTEQQIMDSLSYLAKADLSSVGCIIIAVLSHGGGNGMIYAKDNAYHESKLFNIFQKSKEPTLRGKPVLFIIQACRVDAATPLTPDARVMSTYTLPEEADILIFHSTYQGTPSIRHTIDGSWFIQELCRKVREYFLEDFLSITTRVTHQIAVDKYHGYALGKQMVTCMTTLTRKLYFKKVHPPVESIADGQPGVIELDEDEVNGDEIISSNKDDQSRADQRSNRKSLNLQKVTKHRRPCTRTKAPILSYFKETRVVDQNRTDQANVLIDWANNADESVLVQLKDLIEHFLEFLNRNATREQ